MDEVKKPARYKASIARRDVYRKAAVKDGWRARSAYKLLQIDEEMGLFEGVSRVVDLCAAPGSWSQIASVRTRGVPGRRIIAVDVRSIEPIDGVVAFAGDITDEQTARQIIELLGGECADLVLCDGAPDTIGRIEFDEYVQHSIVRAALCLATMILRPGGSFVAKAFRTRMFAELAGQLGCFGRVWLCKPRASRLSSPEVFCVVRGFTLPEGYVPSLVTANLPPPARGGAAPEFRACGMSDARDPERTYPLSDDEDG